MAYQPVPIATTSFVVSFMYGFFYNFFYGAVVLFDYIFSAHAIQIRCRFAGKVYILYRYNLRL